MTAGLPYAISLFVLYLISLALVLRANNAKMQTLMQSYIICISAILYLENYNVFHPLGIRVQMGHLGNWLEVRRWRAKNSQVEENPYMLVLNNGLSTGTFHI